MKLKKLPVVVLVLFLIPALFYLAGWLFLDLYIGFCSRQLLKLENEGALSREFGYVWQEINSSREMNAVSEKIGNELKLDSSPSTSKKRLAKDFPSLAAIKELNKLKSLYKTITITDRFGIPLAQLQTTHTCLHLEEINDILISSLLATEDHHFFERKKAYDYNALVRAACVSLWRSLTTFKVHVPRGSSTIHMQVARFLLMKYDNRGYSYTEQSLSRKFQEIKLAQALKEIYSDREILTTYVNHCVSAGKGARGYYDISVKLFGIPPEKLSIAQSLYLARLVKWNRHLPQKIIHQIKASMPSLSEHFKWSKDQQNSILQSLDTLTFRPPQKIITRHSHIIDLANEYWKQICSLNGMKDDELKDIDIANPESMIRRYGNLTITLTLDFRLQSHLERLVNARGFGADTTIRSDIRIASEGTDYPAGSLPPDTLRKVTILLKDTIITDPGTGYQTSLKKHDTLIQNIRYKKSINNYIRRSCYTYKRDTLRVSGQYYCYAMIDSRSRELLAYYSRDQLGSRLQSLHTNKNPNGSSTAKPIIYALAYDLGIYNTTDMASDDEVFGDTCAWARIPYGPPDKPVGMRFLFTPDKKGYLVHNHHRRFDGYDYLFNHLSNSNNIMAVETMYRLNTDMSSSSDQSQKIQSLITRTGISIPYKNSTITGPSLYAALTGLCVPYSKPDSVTRSCKDNYSTALGTVELSLYEQMHLFNILYDSKIVLQPQKHPSLFIKSVHLAGNDVSIKDSLIYRTIFDNTNNIKPVQLALHKRLIANPSERLRSYDICNNEGLKSNFAKSGTTDDIIKPYYADTRDTSRTNYGLWNAVLRLKMSRADMISAINKDSVLQLNSKMKKICETIPDKQIIDVTLACIGECNLMHTGLRDGKTLHSYISTSLLHNFGIPCSSGFYNSYEKEIINETSDKVKYAHLSEKSNLDSWSRLVLKLKTGFNHQVSADDITFEKNRSGKKIRLKGKSYRTMLKFSQYLGNNSKHYLSLIEKLREPQNFAQVEAVTGEILAIEVKNQYLKKELQKACESLIASAADLFKN